ncbi:MAG: polysaccharide deacetylase family protein [Candidatus Buchananbacteria bacterium]
MGDIKFCKKFKISLVVFLLLSSTIITSAFFIFDDNKILAKNSSEKNVLIGYDYISPALADGIKKANMEASKDSIVADINIPIIMYHYISDTPPNCLIPTLYTEAKIFEDNLTSLKANGYNTVFSSDLANYFIYKKPLPENPIVLTFDDGYEDFYTNAYPLLKKYNERGVLYVIYEYMDKPGYITRAQAKEMVESGYVQIGSHTLNHSNLLATNYNEAFRQINESRIKLSEALETNIVDFAYPYGKFSLRDEGLVKRAGYSMAVSTYPGTMQGLGRIFALRRLRPAKRMGSDFIKWLKEEENKNY